MADPLADMPDEVRELIAPHLEDDTPEALDAISLAIARRRDEAVAARTGSGIEQVWTDAEEAYAGIDDANRNESGGKWMKPQSMDGPVTTGRTAPRDDVRSTVFVRLTARYVDAGAAKLTEILLPANDKNFSFSEMPVPDLIKAKADKSQVVHDGMGNVPLMRPAKPGEAILPPAATPPPTMAASALPGGLTAPTPSQQPAPDLRAGLPLPGAPAQAGPPMVPLTVADLAEENIELARKKAKQAEDRVYNWLVGCGNTAEVRKVIFDASRIGVGVLKGPVPVSKRGMIVNKAGKDGLEVKVQEKIVPATKWVDPWNSFPDPACGENIHDGDYFLERDFLSPRQLRALKREPGYISAQIDKVIEEGAEKVNLNSDGTLKSADERKQKGRFSVWYYYGALKREEYACVCEAAGGSVEDVPDDQDLIYAIVTLVNDTAIRANINPLDSGEFPYHAFPWQRRAGCWAGVGVGEQGSVPQRVTNAATRAMLNNAGKSAGSQIVVDRGSIVPANGRWVIEPDKIWWKLKDAPAGSVGDAFMAVEIPNVTDQLMKIVQYGMQLMEESTSIPLITQGQSGPTTPDTFGATQLQDNNANQLLRSIGYSFDDYITEPIVRQFYEWFLLDPEIPEDEKGEFEINAHGSIALVERAIMNQTINQMGPLVLNPAYGMDPKKWSTQWLKAGRFNPEDFKYTPEEQARMDQNPIKAIPVQVAEVRTTSAEKIAAGDQAVEGQKAQNDQHATLTDATISLHELALKESLARLDYANQRGISLNQVKSELAQTTMKLTTQKQLNAADNAVEVHKHNNPQKPPRPKVGQAPPVQTPGRAGNGKAFAQAK